jgi:hypothetical protein
MMISAVSYFNPWADKGTLRDLNRLETWQKAAAVAFTALESIAVIYLASYAGLAALCIALPVAALCAIATFRAVVAFAASRISTSPPPPAPITVLPSIEGMDGSQIKNAICEIKIRELLEPNQVLGTAIDNGDCFYDALAKLLRAQGNETITVQTLRTDIQEALSNSQWRQHLQEKVERDPRGIGSFEDYCRDVGKSADQIIPIWGDAKREGVILCEKYKFNLRILQAGLIEGKVLGDEEITMLKGVKKHLQKYEPSNPSLATHEASFQARFRELCNLAANYYTLVQIVPNENTYPVTLTVALFGDHFVPVLPA